MENLSGSHKPIWIRRKSDGKLYNVPSHQLESRLAEKNELGKEIYERVPEKETPEYLKKNAQKSGKKNK